MKSLINIDESEHPLQLNQPNGLAIGLFDQIGNNRNTGYSQIEARTDIEAINIWLDEYERNKNTLDSYRKEVVRLMLWLSDRGKSLSDMTRNDVLAYESFLGDPQPASKWVGRACAANLKNEQGVSYPNPDWRPFVGPLSTRAVKHALTVIGSLCSYLVAAGYLTGNPIVINRRLIKRGQVKEQQRFLSGEIWDFVLDSVEAWPRDSHRQCAEYQRAKWLLHLLYYAALRRSDVSDGVMGDFYYTQSHGRLYWWMGVFGKGMKNAEQDERNKVPVPEPLLKALSEYRRFLGLSELPGMNEKFPLLPNLKNNQPMTSKSVYLIIKKIFAFAADRARDQGLEMYLPVLTNATTHWLRHTSATHQLDAQMDIRTVQKNLRHADIKTTLIYSHTESHKQHEETDLAFKKMGR